MRLKYYAKRKEFLEGQLQAEADKLTNQARFIVEKCDKGLVVENKKRKVMVEELIKRGSFFLTFKKIFYILVLRLILKVYDACICKCCLLFVTLYHET